MSVLPTSRCNDTCPVLPKVVLGSVSPFYIGEVIAFHLLASVFDGRALRCRPTEAAGAFPRSVRTVPDHRTAAPRIDKRRIPDVPWQCSDEWTPVRRERRALRPPAGRSIGHLLCVALSGACSPARHRSTRLRRLRPNAFLSDAGHRLAVHGFRTLVPELFSDSFPVANGDMKATFARPDSLDQRKSLDQLR